MCSVVGVGATRKALAFVVALADSLIPWFVADDRQSVASNQLSYLSCGRRWGPS